MVIEISSPPRRLYRSRKHRLVAGVCGGLGDYFGVDPVLIRLIWIVLCFVYGIGLLFYLIAWIIIPRAPDYVDVESVGPSSSPPPPQALMPASSGNPGSSRVLHTGPGVV